MSLALAGLDALWRRKIETTDRASLLWIRWLFLLVLALLFLYSFTSTTTAPLGILAGLLVFYAITNIALTWASRSRLDLERWSGPLFVTDLILVGVLLYYMTGGDSDLYVMCFLIVYLAALARRVRDALPMAFMVSLLYGLLLHHRNPDLQWDEPYLLLRFPFLFVLALFTGHLSEQADRRHRRIEQMQQTQTALTSELQKALGELWDKQSALVQAEKMTAMGYMAGSLAHEIRTPLSVIIGYAEELLGGRDPQDPLWRPLEAIRRSASRCLDLMQSLLAFARHPNQIESFSLKDALEEALTLVQVGAKMTKVQSVLDIHADPLITARRNEIQQVFINMMTNAVDAMPLGGTLTVRLEEEDLQGTHWIKASVQDTGEGIPPDVRDRIFEPFFTTKPRGKGSGLGLSIVQDIVQSYQGTLDVDSRPHEGTTFVVRLPFSAPKKAPAPEPSTPAAA